MQWVDRKGKRYRDRGFKVEDLGEMKTVCADFIIIGISDGNIAEQVRISLKSIGFKTTQIIVPD